MKLKSILTLAMVAILTMAGGAMAATTATTSNNTLNTPGFGALPTGLPGCGAIAMGVVNTCTVNSIVPATFVTDATTGGGTGIVGGMPAQVTYTANQYTGGVGPDSGYALTANLFGHCGAVCPKYVPASGVTGTNSIAVAGGIPVNVDNFNEATFATGLVSGFAGGVSPDLVSNQLSQKTAHHAFVAAPSGTNSDGDFIDQRLAQVIGVKQTFAQAAVIGSASLSVPVTVVAGAQQAGWLLNVDPFGGPNVQNTGVINQAIADNLAPGFESFGSYGQLFQNTDVSVNNTILPAAVAGAATNYNATSAGLGGVGGGTLALP